MRESDGMKFVAKLEAAFSPMPASKQARYLTHLMKFDADLRDDALDWLESTTHYLVSGKWPSIADVEDSFRAAWVRVQERQPALPSGTGVPLAVALEEDPEVAEAWAHYQEVRQTSAALAAGEEETG